jgi:hypothetical protein
MTLGFRAHLFALPDLAHPRQHRVQVFAPRRHVDVGDLVVVLAPPDRDPQGHPLGGELVDARDLLRQRHRVAP